MKQLPNTYLNIELKGNNPTLVQKTVPLITNYNAEDKILIGSANYFQNKRVQRHFPNCGYYLSRLELYLFIFRGYFGLLKRDGDKFLTVEAPMEHHGIPVYQTFLKATNKIGKPLFVWGANDKDTIQKLIADGVDTDWFSGTFLNTNTWLTILIGSKLFLSIMHKYPEYQSGQKPLVVNFSTM